MYEITLTGLNIFSLEPWNKELLHVRLAIILHTTISITPTKNNNYSRKQY